MNKIITHMDSDRFPVLEVESQLCGIPITDTDAAVIQEMDSVLEELGDSAAGLAAVQIGYPKQIFMLQRDGNRTVYINPSIISRSTETRNRPEACLSLPGLTVKTCRPKSLVLKYYDIGGEPHEETFTGFMAQAVMHEMDHLDGRLIAEYFKEQQKKIVKRTSFGMKLTPHRKKVIRKRREKKARAKRHKQSIRG